MSDDRLFTLTAPDGMIIAKGSMSAVTEHILDTPARADATELLIGAARACGLIESIEQREDALRADSVQRLLDRIGDINARIDKFVARRDELARQDAEAEAKSIQDMLDALPDPDNPEAHFNTGDLSPLPAPPQVPQPVSISLNEA